MLLPAGGCSPARQETLVGAAISLREPLLDLADTFAIRNPGRSIRFEFAASGVLIGQAAEGAPFDLIALAGAEEMDRLEAEGLLMPGTRLDLASNRLAVGIPGDGPYPSSLSDLGTDAYTRIGIGSPGTVPVGRYARQALERAGLWPALAPRLIYADSARQVAQLVVRGEVDAGFLYRSDAGRSPEIRIAFEIDAALHAPIRYPAAILRSAHDPEGAAAFLDLMRGTLGEVILRRYGFGPP